MNSTIETAATALIAPRLLKSFRLRWLVFGAAAYYGLKFMSKRGIFPKQADAALDVIDRGIDGVKSRVGLGPATTSAENLSLHHH